MNYDDRTIAIDGPSGSGKSTLAYALSDALSLKVLETGTLYRSVTLLCIEQNIDIKDEQAVLEVARKMDFHFDDSKVVLSGRDVTSRLREHDIVLEVSHVAALGKVREVLTQKMQDWISEHEGGILEGRDITTVVAPKAKVRIYLDAPEEVRVNRRSEDKKDSASNLSIQDVKESITLRDRIDSNRKVNPLTKADGVLELDSYKNNVKELVAFIVEEYNK